MTRKSNRMLSVDVVGSLHTIAVLAVIALIVFVVAHSARAQTSTAAKQWPTPAATLSPALAAPHAPATSPAE